MTFYVFKALFIVEEIEKDDHLYLHSCQDKIIAQELALNDYPVKESEHQLSKQHHSTRCGSFLASIRAFLGQQYPNRLITETLPCRYIYLCKKSTSFFAIDRLDKGWGCGYRNMQMMLSSKSKNVPSISELKSILQNILDSGIDEAGAEYYRVPKNY